MLWDNCAVFANHTDCITWLFQGLKEKFVMFVPFTNWIIIICYYPWAQLVRIMKSHESVRAVLKIIQPNAWSLSGAYTIMHHDAKYFVWNLVFRWMTLNTETHCHRQKRIRIDHARISGVRKAVFWQVCSSHMITHWRHVWNLRLAFASRKPLRG